MVQLLKMLVPIFSGVQDWRCLNAASPISPGPFKHNNLETR